MLKGDSPRHALGPCTRMANQEEEQAEEGTDTHQTNPELVCGGGSRSMEQLPVWATDKLSMLSGFPWGHDSPTEDSGCP